MSVTAGHRQAPVEPILAQAAESVPGPAALRRAAYEQKLDGHRAMLFTAADPGKLGAGAAVPYVAQAVAAEVVPPIPPCFEASTHFDPATGHPRSIRPKGYAVSTDSLLAYKGLELMPTWFAIALLVLALIGIGLALSSRRRR
ncbi:hypothetical protein [Streptomyces sp. 3211]|uniref:hypothetical protein n=1 Tax=Streptomyces sp. 3211 TaxID=1964449 RepID=UPI0009A49C6D|nr:hypothetical protein [Streptomyces sp. 3211]